MDDDGPTQRENAVAFLAFTTSRGVDRERRGSVERDRSEVDMVDVGERGREGDEDGLGMVGVGLSSSRSERSLTASIQTNRNLLDAMSPAPLSNKKTATSKAAKPGRLSKPARPAEARLPYLHKAMASQIDGGFLDNALRTADKSESTFSR